MVKWLMRRGIARFERQWNYDASYVHEINGLPGLIIGGPNGLVQTNAFEFEGDVVKAISVVRNPDKLRHLASL